MKNEKRKMKNGEAASRRAMERIMKNGNGK